MTPFFSQSLTRIMALLQLHGIIFKAKQATPCQGVTTVENTSPSL